jgi:hypothetical protein
MDGSNSTTLQDGAGTCSAPNNIFHEYQIKVVLEVNGAAQDLYDSTIVTGCFGVPSTPSFTVNDFKYSQALSVGDTVRFWIEVHMSGNYGRSGINNSVVHYHKVTPLAGVISITETSWAPNSVARQFMINEVFSRIVESITDAKMRVKSDYFGRTDSQPYVSGADGPGSMTGLTLGLMLRNGKLKDTLGQYSLNPRLQLSFKEVFNAMNSIHNIGIGMEPDTDRPGNYMRIRIEPIEYFYQNSVVMVCDGIMDVTISNRPDECCSVFKIGYQNYEAEKYTGLDEFNSTRQYRTTLSQIQTEVDQTCQFIASGYCIEVTRQMIFDPSLDQDWRLDNEIFITCLKRGHVADALNKDDGNFADLDGGGVPTPVTIPNALNICVEQGDGSSHPPVMPGGNLIHSPSIYNMRISPVRNMLRWCKTVLQCYTPGQLLSSGFIGLHFIGATGNYFALGYVSNEYISWGTVIPKESDSMIESLVTANDDLKPLIKAQFLKFEYPISLPQFKALNTTPEGIIRCRWGNCPFF